MYSAKMDPYSLTGICATKNHQYGRIDVSWDTDVPQDIREREKKCGFTTNIIYDKEIIYRPIIGLYEAQNLKAYDKKSLQWEYYIVYIIYNM